MLAKLGATDKGRGQPGNSICRFGDCMNFELGMHACQFRVCMTYCRTQFKQLHTLHGAACMHSTARIGL